MFEKEAEEYANHNDWFEFSANVDKIGNAIRTKMERAYIAGAEFGYNKAKVEVEESYKESLCNSELNLASVTEQLEELEKANEWHYVKDGDLPKIGVQVLSEQGTLVIYKGDGFNWVEYSPNADNIKLRKWEEPIAWKEIVLPELKESE